MEKLSNCWCGYDHSTLDVDLEGNFFEIEQGHCDHVGTGRITKFDGGKLPVLCEECYVIIGWDGEEGKYM